MSKDHTRSAVYRFKLDRALALASKQSGLDVGAVTSLYKIMRQMKKTNRLTEFYKMYDEVMQGDLDNDSVFLKTNSFFGFGTSEPIKPCAWCTLSRAHYKCSQCGTTRYCSNTCQRDDWSEHKKICVSELD